MNTPLTNDEPTALPFADFSPHNKYLIDSNKVQYGEKSVNMKIYNCLAGRGCPLNCSFCSVSAFNGNKYRHRPVEQIIEELKVIKEDMVLIVDDNIIGTSKNHINRAKRLFDEIYRAKIHKKYFI